MEGIWFTLRVYHTMILKHSSALEILGTIKFWSHEMYPMYVAVYLDILSPIRRISLAMQQEIHDRGKVIKQIKEFMWTMAKLFIL